MENSKKFTLVCPSVCVYNNKVNVIKAIRTVTGFGLKEAKDACERPDIPQTFEIPPSFFTVYSDPTSVIEDQFRILRNEQIGISDPIFDLIEDLRKLGAQALLQGEDEFASEILQLVLIEKLRRKNVE